MSAIAFVAPSGTEVRPLGYRRRDLDDRVGCHVGRASSAGVRTDWICRGNGWLVRGARRTIRLLAGVACARLFRVERVIWLTPGSLAVSGVVAGALFFTTRVLAVGLLVVFSASITTTIMTGITYRQLASPDGLRSSVNVIGRMIAWGGQPFGAAIGAIVASLMDVEASYAMAAVVMFAAAIAARIALRRQSVSSGLVPA